jgi:sarcosine oxidase delta subunit
VVPTIKSFISVIGFLLNYYFFENPSDSNLIFKSSIQQIIERSDLSNRAKTKLLQQVSEATRNRSFNSLQKIPGCRYFFYSTRDAVAQGIVSQTPHWRKKIVFEASAGKYATYILKIND